MSCPARQPIAPRRSASGGRLDSAGFTLVELLIAMALVLVVIGMAARLLMDGMAGEQRTSLERRAQADAADALDLLASDLRSAISPDRIDPGIVASRDDLLAYLSGSTTSGSRPNGRGGGNGRWWRTERLLPTADVNDIVVATPTQLWLRVEAVSQTAGEPSSSECVGWYIDQHGALVRETRADWRTCAAPGSATVMLPPLPAGMPAQTPFSYSELVPVGGVIAGSGNGNGRVQRGGGNGNGNGNGNPGSPQTLGACETRLAAAGALAAGGDALQSIGLVHVDLLAGSGGRSVDPQRVRSTLEVRNRLTADYLYALGCSG